MTLPCWLRRAVRNLHRHAIEQASRRWRGGRREDSARTCRNILISTQVPVAGALAPAVAHSHADADDGPALALADALPVAGADAVPVCVEINQCVGCRVDGVEVDAKNQHERAVKFDFHTGTS